MLARRPAAGGEPAPEAVGQQRSRFRRRDGEEIERRHAQEVSSSGGFVEGRLGMAAGGSDRLAPPVSRPLDRHCLRQTRSVCARKRKRRSNPSLPEGVYGLFRFARNDGDGNGEKAEAPPAALL